MAQKPKEEVKEPKEPKPKAMTADDALTIASQLRVDQGRDKLIEFLEKLK
jgi:hypothetical protein